MIATSFQPEEIGRVIPLPDLANGYEVPAETRLVVTFDGKHQETFEPGRYSGKQIQERLKLRNIYPTQPSRARAFHYVVYPFSRVLTPQPFRTPTPLSPSGTEIAATAYVKFQIKDEQTATDVLKWFKADLLTASANVVAESLERTLGAWLKERRNPWPPTTRQISDHLNAEIADRGLTIVVEGFVPDRRERKQRDRMVTQLRKLERKMPRRYQEHRRQIRETIAEAEPRVIQEVKPGKKEAKGPVERRFVSPVDGEMVIVNFRGETGEVSSTRTGQSVKQGEPFSPTGVSNLSPQLLVVVKGELPRDTAIGSVVPVGKLFAWLRRNVGKWAFALIVPVRTNWRRFWPWVLLLGTVALALGAQYAHNHWWPLLPWSPPIPPYLIPKPPDFALQKSKPLDPVQHFPNYDEGHVDTARARISVIFVRKGLSWDCGKSVLEQTSATAAEPPSEIFDEHLKDMLNRADLVFGFGTASYSQCRSNSPADSAANDNVSALRAIRLQQWVYSVTGKGDGVEPVSLGGYLSREDMPETLQRQAILVGIELLDKAPINPLRELRLELERRNAGMYNTMLHGYARSEQWGK